MSSQSPSVELVRTVARRKNVDPIELSPLYDAVDPDALDTLLDCGVDRIVVEYAGVTATFEDGDLTLADAGPSAMTGHDVELSAD